jgi:hypothetical protein
VSNRDCTVVRGTGPTGKLDPNIEAHINSDFFSTFFFTTYLCLPYNALQARDIAQYTSTNKYCGLSKCSELQILNFFRSLITFYGKSKGQLALGYFKDKRIFRKILSLSLSLSMLISFETKKQNIQKENQLYSSFTKGKNFRL